MTVSSADWLERLAAVEAGLRQAAVRARSNALTTPDPGSGEQWDEGQVWAHISEFVPYWIGEARHVLAGGGDSPDGGPVPFGRVKTDAIRVATIDQRRHEPVERLADTVVGNIEQLRNFVIELGDSPQVWASAGRHSTLGVMAIADILEEFLVGHLEQHLHQLDSVANRG